MHIVLHLIIPTNNILLKNQPPLSEFKRLSVLHGNLSLLLSAFWKLVYLPFYPALWHNRLIQSPIIND